MPATHTNKLRSASHPAKGILLTVLISALAMAASSAEPDAPAQEPEPEAAQFAPMVTTLVPDDEQGAIVVTPDFTNIVAKEAGLWPNVVSSPDGKLLAFGYNAPAHTTLPGDVDAWASGDGGKSWEWRAAAARRPAETANYCHWASGLTDTGEVIVVASGLDDPATQKLYNDTMTFISSDFGKSWEKRDVFPRLIAGFKSHPFGQVVTGPDGSLRTVVYTLDDQNLEAAWMVTSRDNGMSWDEGTKIAEGINESVLLSLGGQEWLCVARTSNRPAPENGQELRQFRSMDGGVTWTDEGLVAGWHKHPPSLLRLADDRILLTYGNRRTGGIETKVSPDDGKSWGPAMEVFRTGPGDMGYPSTAQLPDGKLVTVFYAHQSSLYDGYQMGAVGWSLP